MANRSLQDYRLYIIHLYKQRCSEEEIAERLCQKGVQTTFSDVLQHLETWRIIPCPSPVHSKDTENPGDQSRPDRGAKLGVTCHHGESSHISQTNLANIPSDSSSIEKFQQDIQKHEEFACGYRSPQVEQSTGTTLSELGSEIEEYNLRDGQLSAMLKQVQKARRDSERTDGLKARLKRNTVVRKGVHKRPSYFLAPAKKFNKNLS